MQTGTMTKENTEYLSSMRDKMGLSKEQAEKIIKGVQNQRLIGGLEAAKNTGSLSLQKVLDMKESGVEIDSFISEEMRLNLYTKEVCPLILHFVFGTSLNTVCMHLYIRRSFVIVISVATKWCCCPLPCTLLAILLYCICVMYTIIKTQVIINVYVLDGGSCTCMCC